MVMNRLRVSFPLFGRTGIGEEQMISLSNAGCTNHSAFGTRTKEKSFQIQHDIYDVVFVTLYSKVSKNENLKSCFNFLYGVIIIKKTRTLSDWNLSASSSTLFQKIIWTFFFHYYALHSIILKQNNSQLGVFCVFLLRFCFLKYKKIQ